MASVTSLKGIFTLIGKGFQSFKNGGKVVEGVRQGEGTLHFLARNTVGTKTGKVLGFSAAAYGVTAASGKGLISLGGSVAEDIMLDEQERGKGVVKGLYRQITDSALGKGTADDINTTATELAQGAADGIKGAVHTVGNVASGGVAMVRDAAEHFTGKEQPQQPSYADPVTGYMPQQTMFNGGAAQISNPLGSIANMLSGITGPNTNPVNLAAMLASGYMMFGGFGWMGKIASLLTGNLAWKSMRQQPAYVPQQNYQQQQSYPFQVAVNPQPQENNDVIPRSRHI